MPARPERLLRHLVHATAAPLADATLLQRFAEHSDEAAFEVLLQRHGPMVVAVCRRVLGNGPDAEDAFQATFLVLARKAGSIRPGAVAAFLHGVARRVALKARTVECRRRMRQSGELSVDVAQRHGDPLDQLTARDPLAILRADLRVDKANEASAGFSRLHRKKQRIS